jgi:hypothetical protein
LTTTEEIGNVVRSFCFFDPDNFREEVMPVLFTEKDIRELKKNMDTLLSKLKKTDNEVYDPYENKEIISNPELDKNKLQIHSKNNI